MKHHKKLAAALACALALGLCAGHVLADGNQDPSQSVDPPLLIAPAPRPSTDVSESAAAETAVSSTPETGLLQRARKAFIVEGETTPADLPTAADPAGTVSFENLGPRLMKNNLNIRALDKNLDAIGAFDAEEMKTMLESAISMLTYQRNQMQQLVDGTTAALNGLNGTLDQNLGIDPSFFLPSLIAYPSGTIQSLDAQLATYESTLEQLKNGEIQDQYDAVSLQLRDAQNQIVMVFETLYLTQLGLEQTYQGLQRNLDSLDRTLAELDIRYEMGQISALTLAEAKAGRTSLVSGMQTLEMNMTGIRRQLEGALGEKITGTIQLQPLTMVSDAELAAVNYESDLSRVKRNSYTLDSANRSVDSAYSEYYDLLDSPTASAWEKDAAYYNKQAADLSADATVLSIELSFASVCDKIRDCQQVLAAARTSHAVKQDSYAAAQLKYKQGVISYNALMSASDALDEAADTVDTAAIELFTAYNNYCWAVEHGILN